MPVEKYKNVKCKVLSFDERTKELDIDFNGYGVRIHNVEKPVNEFVTVKYRGEIGKPDFVCRL